MDADASAWLIARGNQISSQRPNRQTKRLYDVLQRHAWTRAIVLLRKAGTFALPLLCEARHMYKSHSRPASLIMMPQAVKQIIAHIRPGRIGNSAGDTAAPDSFYDITHANR